MGIITPKVDGAAGYKSELGNMIMWCRISDKCVAKDVRVQMTAHSLACIKPHPLFMHAWASRFPALPKAASPALFPRWIAYSNLDPPSIPVRPLGELVRETDATTGPSVRSQLVPYWRTRDKTRAEQPDI